MSSESSKSSPSGIEVEVPSANAIVKMFLQLNEPIFRRLSELRDKGWANPLGDTHFKQQRSRADNVDKNGAHRFFNMMKGIGDELQAKTNTIAQPFEQGGEIKILDLCMAPGGYTASALKFNPTATACGVTLPLDQGGHELLLKSSRSEVLFLDITMLAQEMGVDEVPATHPEQAQFLSDRPYLGQVFHLIFCDGQVLRTHQRAEHREKQEALRLTVSQLALALQRIRPGGTLVMLLHKIEAWDTTELLYRFSRFSSICLFKPERTHAIRSSFYLVATNVQPDSDGARAAIEAWKRSWWRATFGGQNGTGQAKAVPNEGYVHEVLDDFGKELIQLGRPIWEIQANALSKTKFVK